MKPARTLIERTWGPAFVLLLLAGVLSHLLSAEQPLVQTRTSYGGVPVAWGAAYDLLLELRLGATRSRERLAEREPLTTQWIIEPAWSERDLRYELAALEQFARGGGTVLVIGAEPAVWRGLGFVRAASAADAAPGGQGEEAGAPDAGAEHTPRAATRAVELTAMPLRGFWPGRGRRVELSPSELFDAQLSAGSEPRLQSAERSFVLERRLGAGRIVALAGSDFLANARLGNADNALFLVDLARVYGPPSFDERCHGLSAQRSPWAVLGGGFLVLAGLALGLLGVAALQHVRRWPVSARPDDAPPAPTLAVFVTSLASLYRAHGRTEPAAVFRAYRAGALRRLQRHLFGQREVSQAQFEARVESEARRRGPAGRFLRADAAPGSPAELRQAVSALERYAASTHSKRRQ